MARYAQRTVESEDFTTQTLASLALKAPKTAKYLGTSLIPFMINRARRLEGDLQGRALLQAICELHPVPATSWKAHRNVVSYRLSGVSVVQDKASGTPCIAAPSAMDPDFGRLVVMLWSACLLAQAGKTPTTSVPVMARVYGANPAPLLLAWVLREALPPSHALTRAVAHLRSLYRQHARRLAKPAALDLKAAGTLKDRRLYRTPAEALATPPAARQGPAALRREVRLRLMLVDPFVALRCRPIYDGLRADAARRTHALKEFQ